jgi:FkbH-like protein
MYETEANVTTGPSAEIPPEIAAQFGELQHSVLERTVLPWSEHCTECVWPTCYTTCDLYSPREDGRCRRFAEGMVRVDCPDALNSYLIKIRFKQWGKLWTPGNTRLRSLAVAEHLERRDYRIGVALNELIPLSSLKHYATQKRYGFKKRMANRIHASENQPTAFVVECYNPSPEPVRLSLTMRSSNGNVKVPFQKLLEIGPGFHRSRVSYSEITKFLDLASTFTVDLVPNENHETTLYFGLIDFVRETTSAVAAATPDQIRSSRATKEESKEDSKKIKCVVWDLDNTLWDGVLVEDGPAKLRLKPGIVDLIRKLDERGILHSIASKNNRDEALAVLKSFGIDEYFLAPQISWQPKSEAVKAIAAQLNIGIDTLLFVDDSQFELHEVKAVNPHVQVLNAKEYSGIAEMDACQVPVSDQSRERRKMYQVESERQNVAGNFADDYMAFLRHCDIRLNIHPMTEANLNRVHELTQRTNQMNFSGNRYEKSVLEKILSDSHLDTYVLEVEDRFGSYGVVGFSIVDNREPRMTDLMFSCRVQSKRVEHAFLAYVIRKYISLTGKDFQANYRKTPRNAPSGKAFADMMLDEIGTVDGVSHLVFPRSREVPDDGIIAVLAHDVVEPEVVQR